MKGTLITLKSRGDMDRREFNSYPGDGEMLDAWKAAIGGGYVEKVPGFTTVKIDGEDHPCIALCDEEGKLKSLPINRKATRLWHLALRATGHPGLDDGTGNAVDVLCGDIAIVTGDAEFMEAL